MAAAIMMEEKNVGGRPFGTLKYDTVEALDAGIDRYFADCEQRGAPYTLSGLAYSLNITTRTLSNYGDKDGYFPSISRARARCQQYAHECVYDRDKSRGAQFDLSANYGMSDKQIIEVSGPNGGAIEVNQVATLADADLKAIIEIMERSQIQGEVVDITPDE